VVRKSAFAGGLTLRVNVGQLLYRKREHDILPEGRSASRTREQQLVDW